MGGNTSRQATTPAQASRCHRRHVRAVRTHPLHLRGSASLCVTAAHMTEVGGASHSHVATAIIREVTITSAVPLVGVGGASAVAVRSDATRVAAITRPCGNAVTPATSPARWPCCSRDNGGAHCRVYEAAQKEWVVFSAWVGTTAVLFRGCAGNGWNWPWRWQPLWAHWYSPCYSGHATARCPTPSSALPQAPFCFRPRSVRTPTTAV